MENQDSTYGALSDVAAQVPLKEASAPPTVSPKPREVLPPALFVEQPAGFAGITPVNELLVDEPGAYYDTIVSGSETLDISPFVPPDAKILILEFYSKTNLGGSPYEGACDIDVDGVWWNAFNYSHGDSTHTQTQITVPLDPTLTLTYRVPVTVNQFKLWLRGYM
jgi:hypothetical protein